MTGIPAFTSARIVGAITRPPLQLHRSRSRTLENLPRIPYRILQRYLVTQKRKVDHHQCSGRASTYHTSVVDHLLECDGQCRFLAAQDRRNRIANEYRIHSSAVDKRCEERIVRSSHDDLLSARLHGDEIDD